MLKQDVRKRFDETAGSKESSYPSKMPQALGKSLTKQTVNAMLQNDRKRHAPIVTCTLENREKVLPVKMQPFPPSTSRDKDRHTGDAFRERKFKGEHRGSALCSEGNSSGKRGEYTEKRSNPETITVDNFIVDHSSTALTSLTNSDVEPIKFVETLASGDAYEVRKPTQERSDANISDCIKDVTSPRTTRLTAVRKQENSFVENDCKMSHTIFKFTQYYDLNKEKRALVPSPLDEVNRRQLNCNLKLCRENLELIESFAPKTCKDFDTTKEKMINNWLIGIPRVK